MMGNKKFLAVTYTSFKGQIVKYKISKHNTSISQNGGEVAAFNPIRGRAAHQKIGHKRWAVAALRQAQLDKPLNSHCEVNNLSVTTREQTQNIKNSGLDT